MARSPKLGLHQLFLPGTEETGSTDAIAASLRGRYGIPPFSVFDARQGYFQARKRQWLTLGIQSELGRGENVLHLSAACDDYRNNEGEYGKGGNASSPTRLGKTFKSQGSLDEIQDQAKTGRHKPNATPGGNLMPAADLPKNPDGTPAGKTIRGDGKGRRLTWVGGDRAEGELDDASKRILMSGPKKAVSMSSINGVMDRDEDAGGVESRTGTSIFDPVICECFYRWFSPVGGKILDPFAGGSVRGIVASVLGREYYGVDLREEQITANIVQGAAITPDNPPHWYAGDSLNIKDIVPPGPYDCLVTCPPYADLERYSDDPRDISTMDYPDFLRVYREIIAKSVSLLTDNCFACVVVGDVRGKDGYYYGFIHDTIQAFKDAGMRLYNDCVVITSVGSLPVRVSSQFPRGRKVGKAHQNALVFHRGDVKLIGAMDERDIPDVIRLDPEDTNKKRDTYRDVDTKIDMDDLPL